MLLQGYRETQRALIEMTEKTAEIDQLKGATLEDISAMVESITREFKNKQQQLQPLIAELKSVRQEYLDVESQYQEKKLSYEKVAVGLDMEKQSLEKDCTQFQDECLREESRYHQLQNLISISKIRLSRVEQEKKWQAGQGRLMRDFASLKELYANKLAQQDQLTKQLRKRQKELKENAGALTNQKTNFMVSGGWGRAAMMWSPRESLLCWCDVDATSAPGREGASTARGVAIGDGRKRTRRLCRRQVRHQCGRSSRGVRHGICRASGRVAREGGSERRSVR